MERKLAHTLLSLEWSAEGGVATCSEESHGAGRSDGSEIRVVLEEILLQLGEDVLPVGVLPQGRDVRPEHRKTL